MGSPVNYKKEDGRAFGIRICLMNNALVYKILLRQDNYKSERFFTEDHGEVDPPQIIVNFIYLNRRLKHVSSKNYATGRGVGIQRAKPRLLPKTYIRPVHFGL